MALSIWIDDVEFVVSVGVEVETVEGVGSSAIRIGICASKVDATRITGDEGHLHLEGEVMEVAVLGHAGCNVVCL